MLKGGQVLHQIISLFLSGLEAALQGLSILTDACAGLRVCAGCGCAARVCGRVSRVREGRYGAAARPAASIIRGGVIGEP